jgi:hypothetical protein
MVFRIDKTQDYTVMSNYHLREKDMSLKAKGLLSWMLSNDDNWDYSIAGIVANCKENETAIKTALDELQEFGYLEVNKLMPNKDTPTIHYEYIIHEKSVKSTNNQDIDFLGVENLALENQVQRNTNKRNTNKEGILNNKLFNTEKVETKKSKKKNQYQSCSDYIMQYTNNIILQDTLDRFLRCLLEKKNKDPNFKFWTNQWPSIVNELDNLAASTDEAIKIVNQSIQCNWNRFYPLKTNKRSAKSDPSERNVVSDKKDEAELQLSDTVY